MTLLTDGRAKGVIATYCDGVIADSSTLLDEVRQTFATTPTGRELGLLDAEIVDSTLRVTFTGAPDDAFGPYGARIAVPRDAADPLWTRWDLAAGLAEWVMYAVVQAIAEEYLTGGAGRGSRSADDGVVWLVLDD